MKPTLILVMLGVLACDDPTEAIQTQADVSADGQTDGARDASPDARPGIPDARVDVLIRDFATLPDAWSMPDVAPVPDAAPPPEEPLRLAFEAIEHDSGAFRLADRVFLPGTEGEFIAIDKEGAVIHLQLEGDSARHLGSFEVPTPYFPSDAGLLSIALDPRFEENRWFYLAMSTRRDTNVVRRYTWHPEDLAQTLASQVEVMAIRGEGAPQPWHNVGSIGFTPEGYLWALFGDKKLRDQAQDPASPLGKVLRVVPLPEGGHAPAPGNPFADGSGDPRVWALGLRSPWKGHLWRGRLFIGDVGRDDWEEIDVMDEDGQNFGWGEVEGPCPEEVDCADYVEPWVAYGRGQISFVDEDPEARAQRRASVWVGLVYTPGEADPYLGRWNRTIVFGDFFVGFIRGGRADDLGETWAAGHLGNVTAMAQAPDGYVYATTIGTWPIPPEGDSQPAGIYRAVLAPQ